MAATTYKEHQHQQSQHTTTPFLPAKTATTTCHDNDFTTITTTYTGRPENSRLLLLPISVFGPALSRLPPSIMLLLLLSNLHFCLLPSPAFQLNFVHTRTPANHAHTYTNLSTQDSTHDIVLFCSTSRTHTHTEHTFLSLELIDYSNKMITTTVTILAFILTNFLSPFTSVQPAVHVTAINQTASHLPFQFLFRPISPTSTHTFVPSSSSSLVLLLRSNCCCNSNHALVLRCPCILLVVYSHTTFSFLLLDWLAWFLTSLTFGSVLFC